MKKFLFLTIGFVQPTREIMDAWGKWFESIKDRIVEQGHCPHGREITHHGTIDLGLDLNAVTGYLIIKAVDMDDAEKIAKECPMITSTKVYEIMTMEAGG